MLARRFVPALVIGSALAVRAAPARADAEGDTGLGLVLGNITYTVLDIVAWRNPGRLASQIETGVGGAEVLLVEGLAVNNDSPALAAFGLWPAAMAGHGAWAWDVGNVPPAVALAPAGALAVDLFLLALWPRHRGDDGGEPLAVVPLIDRSTGTGGLAVAARF